MSKVGIPRKNTRTTAKGHQRDPRIFVNSSTSAKRTYQGVAQLSQNKPETGFATNEAPQDAGKVTEQRLEHEYDGHPLVVAYFGASLVFERDLVLERNVVCVRNPADCVCITCRQNVIVQQ